MKHLIEAVMHLLRWMVQHNLRAEGIEIVILVGSNHEKYVGNALLERPDADFPLCVTHRPLTGRTIGGIPVRFETKP